MASSTGSAETAAALSMLNRKNVTVRILKVFQSENDSRSREEGMVVDKSKTPSRLCDGRERVSQSTVGDVVLPGNGQRGSRHGVPISAKIEAVHARRCGFGRELNEFC